MVIFVLWSRIYKENYYRTFEEISDNDFTTMRHYLKWLHRFTTNVCVIVLQAGHNYATVFNDTRLFRVPIIFFTFQSHIF